MRARGAQGFGSWKNVGWYVNYVNAENMRVGKASSCLELHMPKQGREFGQSTISPLASIHELSTRLITEK